MLNASLNSEPSHGSASASYIGPDASGSNSNGAMLGSRSSDSNSIPTFITIDLEAGMDPIFTVGADDQTMGAGHHFPATVPTAIQPLSTPTDGVPTINLASLAFNVFGHDRDKDQSSENAFQSGQSHHHWSVEEWQQHAQNTREQTDCRPPSNVQTAEIAKLCANMSSAHRWGTAGKANSVLPGKLINSVSQQRESTTALDEEALAFFVLSSQPIRDSILRAGKLPLTPELINHVLQRLADSWRRTGEDQARARIQTAAELIERYGNQELQARRKDHSLPASERTFTKAIEKFTSLIMEDLHRRRTTSAGILAGTLVAAVYAHAERKDRNVRKAVALTSLLVTGLWAWSFVGQRVALSAAIAVSAFSLFEYFNLAPQRRLEAHELETSFLYAAMDSQSPFDRPFLDGLHFALRVNHIDV
jgi:hypothetical protein